MGARLARRLGGHAGGAGAREAAELGPLPVPAASGACSPRPTTASSARRSPGRATRSCSRATRRSREHKTITLNTNVVLRGAGASSGSTPKQMRRVGEGAPRLPPRPATSFRTGSRFLVANLHATSFPRTRALPTPSCAARRTSSSAVAELEEALIVAGDFNITREQSQTIAALIAAPPESRWSDAGPQIDQVLVRGATRRPSACGPTTSARYDGRLLSDHAPVEVEHASSQSTVQACSAVGAVRSPSSAAIGCSAATTFAMCSSSSSPSSSAPA